MRNFYLTASLITAALLAACAEAPQTELETAPAPQLSETAPAPQESAVVKPQPTTPSLKTSVDKTQSSDFPQHYQGLDPKEVSRAEIDELIALQKEQQEFSQAYQTEIMAWSKQDPAFRGEQPKWNPSPRSQKIQDRLMTLNNKVQIASIRKLYENLDPKVISKAEVEELIALQKEQMKLSFEYRKKIQAWSSQDPSTRGPQPEMNNARLIASNPRLQELQGKIHSASNIQRLADRVKRLSAAYNITLSDSELGELSALETESLSLIHI